MKHIRFLPLLVLIFGSCASLPEELDKTDKLFLTKENLHLINGKYGRNSNDTPAFDLFECFINRYYNKGNDFVIIEVVNEKSIKVDLYNNNHKRKTKLLKGKLKRGYFEFRRRYAFKPFIVANLINNTKSRIGLLKNNNLIIDLNEKKIGTIYFIMPFYQNYDRHSVEYLKITK